MFGVLMKIISSNAKEQCTSHEKQGQKTTKTVKKGHLENERKANKQKNVKW